jgi:glutamate synthase (ferredoxin)
MRFVAAEIREWMALIGVKTFDELVGHVEYLKQVNVASKTNIPSRLDPQFGIPVFDSEKAELAHWSHVKASNVDLSQVIHQVKVPENNEARHHTQNQDFKLHEQFDLQTLVPLCSAALEGGQKIISNLNISNRNRTVSTILSSEIARRYGSIGLPEDTICLNLKGSGGQSFGAFLSPGITLSLKGDTNDYLGKGLSGGKIIIAPTDEAGFDPKENILVGNVAFYGATGGEAYLRGIAGERFCVRNSGVSTVVEGVGDHGCEYMTGGHVVILGSTGRNFAAGMSGGIVYIYNKLGKFESSCNTASVILQKPDKEHAKTLKYLLENHLKYTESDIAKKILANFDKNLKDFIVVIPRDYKKIMEALKEAKAAGVSEEKQSLYAFNSVILGKAKV